jgi:hypothetical protein
VENLWNCLLGETEVLGEIRGFASSTLTAIRMDLDLCGGNSSSNCQEHCCSSRKWRGQNAQLHFFKVAAEQCRRGSEGKVVGIEILGAVVITRISTCPATPVGKN